MGRLVLTHSTYIEGLIPELNHLAKNDMIKTITPAVISKTKGRCVGLKIRSSPKVKGGYKLLARKGTSVQEVFIITRLQEEELDALLGNK